jgi:M6 family metalloprotease-like protein
MSAKTLAAPFDKAFAFIQPDGTAIQVHGWGDEFHADFETLDGYAVLFDQTAQAYVYASLSPDGLQLVSSGLVVGRADPLSKGLAKHLRADPKTTKAEALKRFKRWDDVTRNSSRWRAKKSAFNAGLSTMSLSSSDSPVVLSPPSFTTTGTKVGLTLLIDFDDDTNTIPRAEIINFCNGDAYTGYGNNGSVKKYYQDNSNNLLTYTNIVTAYVRLPNTLHPKSYYNDTSKDCGYQANYLIRDAIAVLKALPNYATEIAPVFSNLTRDASGYVAAFNVYYAGGNGGVWSYGLWPHSWSLYVVGAQTLVAGVVAYDYQVTNIGSSLELGTFCHENGHMLCGYPDIYDYDYDSIGGAGAFCLMNSGGHGVNPVQICAYLKRASGWATTVELTSLSGLTATVASSGAAFNRFYRFAKPGVSTEYYLVENRHRSGRDANIPASGTAIWHIDENGDKDNQSLAYNTTNANYEVTLMQADNLWHFENYSNSGDTNDLYYSGNSASGYINAFSDDTSPSARWWDGTASGLSFNSFGANGTNMTFTVTPASTPAIITASSLPAGIVAVPYGATLTASGGTLPYTWSVVSNALPAGLALSSAGAISGTPGTVTSLLFRVRVVTATGKAATNLFSLSISARRAVPFTEDFEAAGAMPSGWSQEYLTNSTSWTFQTGGHTYPSAAHGGSYNACLYYGGTTPQVTRLITPLLDFGGSTKNAQLTFWHYMRLWTSDQDELRVYYRSAPTNAWQQLAAYTANVSSWTQRTLSLPSPSRAYGIAFVGCAKFGYGVCIDDVSVTGDASAYATWQTNRFTAAEMIAGAITGDSDDPDGDGIVNLLEYAQGLDPRSADANELVGGGVLDLFLTLNYRQNKQATDVTCAVESCTNLVSAVWATNGVSEVSRIDSNDWWSVTVRHDVPLTNVPSRFMRLRVDRP